MRDKSGRMRGACESCNCREYQAATHNAFSTSASGLESRLRSSQEKSVASGGLNTASSDSRATVHSSHGSQRCTACHHSVALHLALDLARARRKARELSTKRATERQNLRAGKQPPPLTHFATAAILGGGDAGKRRQPTHDNRLSREEAWREQQRERRARQLAAAAPKKLTHEIDVDLYNKMRMKYRNKRCKKYVAGVRCACSVLGRP